MIKKVLLIFSIIITSALCANAHICENPNCAHSFKKSEQIDAYLTQKLNLTKEQKETLENNKKKHIKEIKKIIKKMQDEHDSIRNVYLSGIPKFQADVKTAPSKTRLVILKIEADKLREQNRKNFENTLTQEQKIEFEKIKQEFRAKKQAKLDSKQNH